MDHLQDSDHMVQKPPYWNANYPVGHLKQRKFRLTSFVLDVPVGNLGSNMAVFVPCDHYPAKGPLAGHSRSQSCDPLGQRHGSRALGRPLEDLS